MEVSGKVLTALKESTKTLNEKLSAAGVKLVKGFTERKPYERPNDVEQTAEFIDSAQAHADVLVKALDEAVKDRDEAAEMAKGEMVKVSRLIKGDKICPSCIGVKIVNSQPCGTCKGDGFLGKK